MSVATYWPLAVLARIQASTAPDVPCSRPCTFMWVKRGRSPARTPICIVSSIAAREEKWFSGVRRSWLVKLVRHGRAASTTLMTSAVVAK